jgi:hypothetical protein
MISAAGYRVLRCRRPKSVLSLFLLLATVLTLTACNSANAPSATPENTSTGSVLSDLLSQPLWVERDAYDASHHLMVPMHAAFWGRAQAETNAFHGFFDKFQSSGIGDLVSAELVWRLDRLHFLYFYSRYLSLSVQRDGCTPRSVSHYQTLSDLWLSLVESPAWQWDQADFPNIFTRIDWKLRQGVVRYSYYRAITDEDLFAIAVGADLQFVSLACGIQANSRYRESMELARRVFSSEVQQTSVGGWILQRGVWADHPDYAYVGNAQLAPDLSPKPLSDISPDSSHSFRLPIFLLSFSCAELSGSEWRARFNRLESDLGVQWSLRVASLPTESFRGVRMTNFMDGENGVYRYGYPTQGAGRGFGPYQLSGSFNLGWWAFVGPAADPFYSAQLAMLPFESAVVAEYVGPNTTRVRNPLFTEPGFYTGELVGKILQSAVAVSNRPLTCP